tara:strand:+ start:544 stop:759 length:216 start_codon:yes stop_codon:yes gene_type:complete
MVKYTQLDGVRSGIMKIDANRRTYLPRWVLTELKISHTVGEIPAGNPPLGYVVFVKKGNDIVIKKVKVEAV